MQGGEHWCALGVSASAVFAQNGGVGWLVALVCTGQALQGASAVFALDASGLHASIYT